MSEDWGQQLYEEQKRRARAGLIMTACSLGGAIIGLATFVLGWTTPLGAAVIWLLVAAISITVFLVRRSAAERARANQPRP